MTKNFSTVDGEKYSYNVNTQQYEPVQAEFDALVGQAMELFGVEEWRHYVVTPTGMRSGESITAAEKAAREAAIDFDIAESSGFAD